MLVCTMQVFAEMVTYYTHTYTPLLITDFNQIVVKVSTIQAY